MISPRSRRNYLAHDVYDHTSVLKAVEWRWGLSPLTPRDSAARNIAEVLDFDNPPNLSAPQWTVPPFVGRPCALSTAADYEDWHALRDLARSEGWKI